jgi:hypothetical protein
MFGHPNLRLIFKFSKISFFRKKIVYLFLGFHTIEREGLSPHLYIRVNFKNNLPY